MNCPTSARRSVTSKTRKNEIELLILVTPELVEGIEASEVPRCGPGMATRSPSDWELFMKGYLEVPNCCPAGEQNCKPSPEGEEVPPPEGMIEKPGDKAPPQRADTARHYNRQNPPKTNPNAPGAATRTQNDPPGFIGPVGYDVVK